jgi:hypothetical protein
VHSQTKTTTNEGRAFIRRRLILTVAVTAMKDYSDALHRRFITV